MKPTTTMPEPGSNGNGAKPSADASGKVDLESICRYLADAYPSLSPQLKRAAGYVLENPSAVAFQSIRKSAKAADVTPSTLMRLAKRFGYESYDLFRDVFQHALQAGSSEYSGRANQLRQQASTVGSQAFLEVGDAVFDNMGRLFTRDHQARVDETAGLMLAARKVAVIGFRDSFACAYHFAYVGHTAMPDIHLVRGLEGGLPDELDAFEPQDLAVVFDFAPYCSETLRALDILRAKQVPVVAITDTLTSPLVPGARLSFNLSNASVHFFPSILPVMTLIEVILAEYMAKGPEQLLDNVTRFEQRMRDMGAYRDQ